MQNKEITQIAVLINKVENLQADITDIKATLKADTVRRVEFEYLNKEVENIKVENNKMKWTIISTIAGLISMGVGIFIFRQ